MSGASVTVTEEWRFIDKWWTDEPFERHYRSLSDGRVEWRARETDAWQEYDATNPPARALPP